MTKSRIKSFLLTFTIAFLPTACFCGGITATLAWYTYDSGAVLDYNGTAISLSNFLQVGIKATYPELEKVGLVIEDGVAWSEPGVGLNPEQINCYLAVAGYATEALTPLTSGPYDGTGPLELKSAPAYGILYNPEPGKKSSYVGLPLAFRVTDTQGIKKKNVSVWLQNAEILCKEYENLTNGVRLHFTSDASTFILHPASTLTEVGYTALAGLQDLNFDKYYDYDYETGNELMYGLYTGDVNYIPIDEDSELDDINKTGHTSESTFCSRHKGKRNSVQSYEGLTFEYAEYETLYTITPVKKSDGTYEGGRAICVTGDDDTGIGYADMTMWIEGWDHSVYDKAEGYRFLMNLTFKI